MGTVLSLLTALMDFITVQYQVERDRWSLVLLFFCYEFLNPLKVPENTTYKVYNKKITLPLEH